jgi:Protein of unknown function (DUF3575)
MRKLLLLLGFLPVSLPTIGQTVRADSVIPYTTTLKINFNGLRVGLEQKIGNRTTIQLEGLYLGPSYLTINPQLRYYPRFFKRRLTYFGLGYFYKHQEYDMSDSVRLNGTFISYEKSFQISKYIHAVTINYGCISEESIFGLKTHLEFNIGLGTRFKKSNRYGLLPDEEIHNDDSFILRQQQEQDTHGRFAIYPELNLVCSLLLPLKE